VLLNSVEGQKSKNKTDQEESEKKKHGTEARGDIEESRSVSGLSSRKIHTGKRRKKTPTKIHRKVCIPE